MELVGNKRKLVKQMRARLAKALENAADDWEREFIRQAIFYVHLWGRHIQPDWQKDRRVLPNSLPPVPDDPQLK